MPIDTVFFDMDGTLVDTLQDIADSVNRLLTEHDLPVHDLEAYKLFVGEGARELIDRALPSAHRALADELLRDFREDYSAHMLDQTGLYEGIPAMLNELFATGRRVAILSNKPEAMTVHIVEAILSEWPFEIVRGAREGVPKKPDPIAAIEMLAEMGGDAETTAFVGDTKTDMLTARALGMTAIGVSWGFRDTAELWQTGANVVIDHPRQLVDAIEASSGS